METFRICIRFIGHSLRYNALAPSSMDAWDDAATAQGDTPCGITVTPVGAQ